MKSELLHFSSGSERSEEIADVELARPGDRRIFRIL